MSAAQEYKRMAAEVQKLVDRIPTVLAEHAKRQETTPQYWTHTADLRKVRRDILETLSFLNDLEAKEQLLAEGEPR